MHIRPLVHADLPAMIAIHNSLGIAWPECSSDPQEYIDADARRDPRSRVGRWIADQDGQPLGFARYSQSPEEAPLGWFNLFVEVRPEHQRHGIGSALDAVLLAELAQHQPRILRADAFTNLPQGYRWLQQQGFREMFRETPVCLDLQAFDPAPFAGLEARFRTQGIQVRSVSELADDPGRDRKLYELYLETGHDVPSEDVAPAIPSFDDWLKNNLHDPTTLQDAYFVAIRDGEYLGLREEGALGNSDAMYGSLLGVKVPAYRQQGLGLLLHLKGVLYAREHGYRWFRTCTAVQNVPMQRLFDRLGYRRDPEWQQCQKDV